MTEPDQRGTSPSPSPARPISIYDSIRVPADQRTLGRLPNLLLRAIRLVRGAGGRTFDAVVAIQLVSGVAVGAQILVARYVLEEVLQAQDEGAGIASIAPSLLLLVGITTLVALGTAAQRELSSYLSEVVSREATGRILDVAAAVDLEAYETPEFHDRLERARFNANNRPVMAVNGLLGIASGIVTTAGITVGLVVLHPLLVPVTMLALVPLWLAESRNGRAFYRFTVEMTPIDRERIYLANTLSSKPLAKEVRAFSTTPFLRGRFDHLYATRIERLGALVRGRLRNALVGSIIASAGTAATLLLLFGLLLSGRMDLASTGAAVLGITYLAQRLRGIAASAGSLFESSLFIDDFFTFLELAPDPRAASADPVPRSQPTTLAPQTDAVDVVDVTAPRRPATDPSGSASTASDRGFDAIVVDDITFTYPGAHRPALRNVTIEIGRGEVVALVGDNGSGKTTLAKILGLLYTPTSGHVRWDGSPVEAADVDERRRSIAAIFQDFGQYWLSARDNIALGDIANRDDLDAIVAAALRVHADEFIAPLPNGYDTVLSRMVAGGTDLSIGQWQRVALARAFFRDAPLVIMDEPTAALDAASEAKLFDSIRSMSVDRSVLLISHRFSSVRSADRIYVLHRGEVVEVGSHEELMARGGRYATMFSLQASAYL